MAQKLLTAQLPKSPGGCMALLILQVPALVPWIPKERRGLLRAATEGAPIRWLPLSPRVPASRASPWPRRGCLTPPHAPSRVLGGLSL